MKKTDLKNNTDKRDRQRQRLIDAAEDIIAAQGLNNLKTRTLATKAGMALGQIYNLVGDMDEIILQVNSRTITRLESELTQQIARVSSKTAEEKLTAIATHYHHFARTHYHLWHALFDHHPERSKKHVPDWVSIERLRPFHLIEELLTPLCPHMQAQERHIFAQTLFSSVHGIVLLALDAHDVGVPQTQIDEQLRLYLQLLCHGIVSACEN